MKKEEVACKKKKKREKKSRRKEEERKDGILAGSRRLKPMLNKNCSFRRLAKGEEPYQKPKGIRRD